jgi:hypothetical protein
MLPSAATVLSFSDLQFIMNHTKTRMRQRHALGYGVFKTTTLPGPVSPAKSSKRFAADAGKDTQYLGGTESMSEPYLLEPNPQFLDRDAGTV